MKLLFLRRFQGNLIHRKKSDNPSVLDFESTDKLKAVLQASAGAYATNADHLAQATETPKKKKKTMSGGGKKQTSQTTASVSGNYSVDNTDPVKKESKSRKLSSSSGGTKSSGSSIASSTTCSSKKSATTKAAKSDDTTRLSSSSFCPSPSSLRRYSTASGVLASSTTSSSSSSASPSELNKVEWQITNYDESETEAQSMEQELHRLQVLQSYLLLDSDTEEDFDRITSMAAKVFHVPIAVISLVDLGRQWFLSKQGLAACETPRKHAFCAHVILNVKNILVVPDASQDVRFQDNPLVTGPPDIRFYAGAALVSPEGYKLGTVCIIDSKPRTLSTHEQTILHDFAAMAMSCMVDRRSRLQNQDATRAKILAHTCRDVATSLVQVHNDLTVFQNKVQDKLDPEDVELIASFTSHIQLKARTCKTALRSCAATMEQLYPPDQTTLSTTTKNKNMTRQQQERRAYMDPFLSSSLTDLLEDFEKISTGESITKLVDLYDNLNRILAPLPHKVPVTLDLLAHVPLKIVADDLLLFRSALNLLSSSMDRTKNGHVKFRMYATDDQVVFECEDTGPAAVDVPVRSGKDGSIDVDDSFQDKMAVAIERANRFFFHSADSLLTPMASMVNSMGGDFGVSTVPADDETMALCRNTFWFTVPLVLAADPTGWSTQDSDLLNQRVEETLTQTHAPKTGPILSIFNSNSDHGDKSNSNKTQVLVDDPFQAAFIKESCFSSALEPTLRSEGARIVV